MFFKYEFGAIKQLSKIVIFFFQILCMKQKRTGSDCKSELYVLKNRTKPKKGQNYFRKKQTMLKICNSMSLIKPQNKTKQKKTKIFLYI